MNGVTRPLDRMRIFSAAADHSAAAGPAPRCVLSVAVSHPDYYRIAKSRPEEFVEPWDKDERRMYGLLDEGHQTYRDKAAATGLKFSKL